MATPWSLTVASEGAQGCHAAVPSAVAVVGGGGGGVAFGQHGQARPSASLRQIAGGFVQSGPATAETNREWLHSRDKSPHLLPRPPPIKQLCCSLKQSCSSSSYKSSSPLSLPASPLLNSLPASPLLNSLLFSPLHTSLLPSPLPPSLFPFPLPPSPSTPQHPPVWCHSSLGPPP